MSSGRLLARNSALNLIGQVAPLLVAVLTIPALVKGFGAERFGILTLAWAAIGYFGLFELGLSRALTHAVAQRLGSGKANELGGVTRQALDVLVFLGIVGGVAVAASTPLLVDRVLKVPEDLRQEALYSFWVLSLSLPFVLGTIGLRGIMEAHQHFGAATALRIPTAVLSYLAPLFVLPFTHSIVPAVAALAVARVVGFGLHLIVCRRSYLYLSDKTPYQPGALRNLLRFGGWTTVTNIVSPLMVYADRFVIGSTLSLAAVTAYVTPYEVVVKLLLIPMALAGVFMPAFAATVESDPRRMSELYERSIRSIMLVMFPVILTLIALADVGLRVWMKDALPAESVRILQWLALGVFVTAVAQAPFTVLQGAARPDLTAKLHVAEVPFYIVMLVAFMRWRGLEGVAIAWTARTAIDAIALLWMAHRQLNLRIMPKLGGVWSLLIMISAMGVAASIESVAVRIAYAAIVCVLFTVLAWTALLTESERDGLRSWIGRPSLAS